VAASTPRLTPVRRPEWMSVTHRRWLLALCLRPLRSRFSSSTSVNSAATMGPAVDFPAGRMTQHVCDAARPRAAVPSPKIASLVPASRGLAGHRAAALAGGLRHGSGPSAVRGPPRGSRPYAVRVCNSLTSEVMDSAGASNNGQDYDASKIQVLEGLEPVRKRPGMYIGSTCVKGLHHLLYEVLDNSIDEAQAGHASRVEVLVGADRRRVQITDDGRGIPVDVHPTTGVSALETVLTVLHAGGKFGGESSGYKVSGGLHGVGVSVCNALSSSLHVSVLRDGQRYFQSYERGLPATELLSEPAPHGDDGERAWHRTSGTSITFVPDDQIFNPDLKLDERIISSRLRELAFLNPGVEVVFQVEGDEPQTFLFTGGIREYAEWINRDKDTLHPAFAFDGEGEGGVQVSIAMQWCSDSFTDTMLGYANSVRTVDGGTHFDGLRAALTRNVNACARKMNKLKDADSNLLGEYIREGLTCVVATKVPNPEFQGQTKTRLGNQEVRKAVESTVTNYLPDFFELNPEVLDHIVAKAMQAMKAAEAAKRARELVRRKSVLRPSALPGKLADCACQDPQMSEIFIVEGESAGGSAKMARSRHNQAILPLKGKILNVEKKDDSKIYKNTEISNLIMALGLGFRGEELAIDNLRYHKIIILTDADVDGAHIRTLLLTFLYRYQSDLFTHGFVYVGMPPLYMVQSPKGKVYCYDDKDLQSTLDELGSGVSYTIQRFKVRLPAGSQARKRNAMPGLTHGYLA